MVFHFYGYSFLVNFFLVFFILGRAVDQAGLTASFRAYVNIVFLLTYLLTYTKNIMRMMNNSSSIHNDSLPLVNKVMNDLPN